jgi:hypothetical protein
LADNFMSAVKDVSKTWGDWMTTEDGSESLVPSKQSAEFVAGGLAPTAWREHAPLILDPVLAARLRTPPIPVSPLNDI